MRGQHREAMQITLATPPPTIFLLAPRLRNEALGGRGMSAALPPAQRHRQARQISAALDQRPDVVAGQRAEHDHGGPADADDGPDNPEYDAQRRQANTYRHSLLPLAQFPGLADMP